MPTNNFTGMIRTVITPEQQNISINFVGKQVEVIVFTINDVMEASSAMDKPLTYLASEKVLAKDWLTLEEDAAWQDL
jgi:hypothetical protein